MSTRQLWAWMMISIVRHDTRCSKLSKTYSLYVNKTVKVEFEHIREPEDLAQMLRDAADAVDLSNGITPFNHIQKVDVPRKLTMQERMCGIKSHLEKQEMDYNGSFMKRFVIGNG